MRIAVVFRIISSRAGARALYTDHKPSQLRSEAERAYAGYDRCSMTMVRSFRYLSSILPVNGPNIQTGFTKDYLGLAAC